MNTLTRIAILATITSTPALAQFGGFYGPQTYPAGPTAVFDSGVGDFNNDGKADIVVAYGNHAHVRTLLGDGAGGFGAPVTTSVPSQPYQTVTAHLNDDAYLDLAVGTANANEIRFLAGDGAGGFTEIGHFQPGYLDHFTFADFNGDGILDVATTSSSNSQVLVYPGLGGFQFGAPDEVIFHDVPAYGPYQVIPSDTDQDGDVDLIVVGATANFSTSHPGKVSVLANNGAGQFQRTSVHNVGSVPHYAAIADINGDGWTDLAVPHSSEQRLSVLMGDGLGGFLPETRITCPAAVKVALTDIDGDGDIDVLVGNGFTNQPTQPRTMQAIINSGGGVLQTLYSFPISLPPAQLHLVGLNGDASPDVLISDAAGLTVMLNITEMEAPAAFALVGPEDGAAGMHVPQNTPSPWPDSVAALDWTDAAAFHRTYHVRIATNAELTNIVAESFDLTESRYEIPSDTLLPGTTYYWSVTAANPTGSIDITGGPFQFTTAPRADINSDGSINFADLNEVLSSFNTSQ